MNSNRRSTLLGIAQLIFVVVVIFLALTLTEAMKPKQTYGDGQDVAFADSTVSVTVISPGGETFTPQVKLTGSVTAQTETQIAPQVSGRVVWVSDNFTPGARVKKGDILFRIDSEDFELAIEQADAAIAEASSELQRLTAEAKVALSEWRDLYPNQPISDLAARKPQTEAAQARLAAARASKKTAQLALRRTRVTAPAHARILTSTLDVGQLVAPSMPVGALYALNNVEIAAPISPQDLQILSPVTGRDVSLKLETRAGTISGIVSRVGSVLDPRTRQATLFIQPENVSGLTIGSFVEATIAASPVKAAVRLPATALAGRSRVWVLKNGTLESRDVYILNQTVDNVTVAPFDIGDGVLTLPPAEAYNGQKARARNAEY